MGNTSKRFVFFIINPISGGGTAYQYWEKQKSIYLSSLEDSNYEVTKYVGHATEIAKNVIEKGFNTIISIGGDGLNNEIINGLIENDKMIREDLSFGLIPLGTGSDLAKTLKIVKNPYHYLDLIRENQTETIDVGKVTFQNNNDIRVSRYFLNVAEAGFISNVICTYSSRNLRLLKNGVVPYLLSYIQTTRQFDFDYVAIKRDEEPGYFEEVANINVANAQFYGGGFKIAPQANVKDGKLDAVIFKRQGWLTFSLNMLKSLRGTHLQDKKHIEYHQIKCLEVQPMNPLKKIHLDIDGDIYGCLPAKFEVVPKLLKVIC